MGLVIVFALPSKPERILMRHQILTIDIVGNEEGGFEVNELKTTNNYVDLNDQMTDRQIIAAVREVLGHDEGHDNYRLDEGSNVEYGVRLYSGNQPCYFTNAMGENYD